MSLDMSQQKPALVYGELIGQAFSDWPKVPSLYLQKRSEILPQGELIDVRTNTCQTYAQLWDQATLILGGLRKKDIVPGKFIILLVDSYLDLVRGFWACLMGGFIVIPIRYFHQNRQSDLTWRKINHILSQVEDPIILTTQTIDTQLKKHLISSTPTFWLNNLDRHSLDLSFYPSQPSDLAALFLSSGTTGIPKLVSFTGEALVNRWIITTPEDPCDCALSWLPFDHASACLRLVSIDIHKKILLPIEEFIADPTTWLKAIEVYQVTQASMTNFGMALINQAVRTPPDQIWNLQSIRSLGIGAESIDPVVYQTFLNNLIPFGLDPEGVATGYGLSECGTVVSSSEISFSSDNPSQCYVSVGDPIKGYSVRIVNEQNIILNEKEIGQVQIQSPTMTTGYYKDEEQTKALFTDDSWMKTGDLGFIYNGHLTIVGREKDIIIINAKNYTSQEIEKAALVNGIEQRHLIACSTRKTGESTDTLVLFLICSSWEHEEFIELINRIRNAISSQLGIMPSLIIPITENEVPRVALGKIQRVQMRQNLESGIYDSRLHILSERITEYRKKTCVLPETRIQRAIAQIWEQVLDRYPIGIYDHFFDLGGNSISAVQLIQAMDHQFGSSFDLIDLFQGLTIAEWANSLQQNNRDLSTPDQHLIYPQPNDLELTATEYRTLLASTVPYRGQRIGSRQLVTEVRPGTNPTASPFIWIGPPEIADAFPPGGQPVCLLPQGKSSLIECPEVFFEAVSNLFAEELLQLYPGRKFVLGGYCFTGKITSELARRLQILGREVDLLILVEMPPANVSYQNWARTFSTFLGRYLLIIQKILAGELGSPSEIIKKYHKLDQRIMIQNTTKHNEIDISTDPQRQASRSYSWKPYSGKILFISSRNHWGVLGSELRLLRGLAAKFYGTLGWKGILTGKIETHILPIDAPLFGSSQASVTATFIQKQLDKLDPHV